MDDCTKRIWCLLQGGFELNNLSQADLVNLIKGSLELDYTRLTTTTSQSRRVVGSILPNASSMEKEILNLTCARYGLPLVEFGIESKTSFSTGDILDRVTVVSSAIDLLVTSFCESDTFGAAHQLTEQLPEYSRAPVVSLMDDIYAPQPAMGILAALYNELGSLSGKSITISWGYGSSFTSPRIAHSLLTLGMTLGSEITVLTPSEFPLLRRVIRVAEDVAKESKGHFNKAEEFKQDYLDADAIIGLNWCRLDDCNHFGRNQKAALKYKDWYFTEDILGSHSFFISEPPLQSDLLASPSLIHSQRNLTPSWIDMRARILMQSFNFVKELQLEGRPPALL
jgi:ornithine carbamoyltransferase